MDRDARQRAIERDATGLGAIAALDASPVDIRDEYMDYDAAATFLRVSRSWLEASDVPRIRFGKRVVFLRSTLLRFGKAREN